MTESIRKAFLGLLLAFVLPFLSLQKSQAAEITLSQAYTGTGTYVEESPSITISAGNLINGSNFKFVSYLSGSRFALDNDIAGYFIYTDALNNTITINGVISRHQKSGGLSEGFYFYETTCRWCCSNREGILARC